MGYINGAQGWRHFVAYVVDSEGGLSFYNQQDFLSTMYNKVSKLPQNCTNFSS